MRILKKNSVKSTELVSLIIPILEYDAGRRNPYRKHYIEALEKRQRRVAKVVIPRHERDKLEALGWESLSSRKRENISLKNQNTKLYHNFNNQNETAKNPREIFLLKQSYMRLDTHH